MSHFHRALVDRVELVDIEPTKWMACKALLGAIANHANEQEADLSWPGVELLMLETGASERVVVRTTTLLHAKGWIVKKRRSGTSNLYRLNVAKLKAHQVDRGAAQPVFMAKHLEGMTLPGEDPNAPVAVRRPTRSTSRQRAKQGSEQPTRRFGVSQTPDRHEGHADLAGASRQIGDVIISEPSGNPLPPRAGSPDSLAVGLGATEEEMNLLVEKVRRDHPHVKVPSAWLRRVWERGDLEPMLDEVRAAANAPAAPSALKPCGECQARDGDPVSARLVWLDEERRRFNWCPRCHPLGQHTKESA